MPTAWSSSGSLVSDRIPPKQQQKNKGKGKAKAPTPEPSKSKAVRVLEARLDGPRGSNGRAKDPKGGCFCQGKSPASLVHPLRTHCFCRTDPVNACLTTSSKPRALELRPDVSTVWTDSMYAQPAAPRVSALRLCAVK